MTPRQSCSRVPSVPAATTPRRSQCGALLIEVLVAMVVLAIALLGMAGLTSSSMQVNQFSRMRATGLSLVADYTERARANPEGFNSYAYTPAAYTPSQRTAATTDPTAPPNACQVDTSNPLAPVNTCSAAIADYDQRQWLTNVANRLPGGTAYVTAEFTAADPAVHGLPATRILNLWLIWRALTEDPAKVQTCPDGLNIPNLSAVNCMYFRVTL
ncbi:MAG: type IV pilus modification protein PilV [Rhodocyclaceae bacterium]|nr:type IV pilus modification protein PilV [Pseudomonadota bacterium]MDQ7972015.1 type IV pilus modification protein PilV [Rhodocyclaceae bacterium]